MRVLAQRPNATLLLICAGALALRLFALWLAEPTSLAGDEFDYFKRAVAFARGEPHPDPAGRAPLAIAVYGTVFKLFHPWGQLAKATNAVFGALLVLPVHGLARAYAGDRAGWLAASMVALYPGFIAFSIALWSEPVFMLLVTTAMLALVQALAAASAGHAGAWLAFAGALFGLGALAKESALLLPFAMAVYYALRCRRQQVGRARSPMLGAALLLCAFGLVIAPRVIAINERGAPLALITRTSYMNLYVGNSPHGEGLAMRHYTQLGDDRVAAERRAREIAVRDISARMPAWPFEKAARQLPRFFKPGSFAVRRLHTPHGDPGRWGYGFRWSWLERPAVRIGLVVVVVLAYLAVLLPGAAGLVLSRKTELSGLFALFIVIQILPSILPFSMCRFRLPSMVFFIVGAASLVSMGRSDWRVASPQRRGFALGTVATLLLLVSMGYESALVATEG